MSTASHSLRILLSGGQGRFVSTSRYVQISPWIERTGCRFEQWTQGEIRMEATTEREREEHHWWSSGNQGRNIKHFEERAHNRTYQVSPQSWVPYPPCAWITNIYQGLISYLDIIVEEKLTLSPSSSGEISSRAASSSTLFSKSFPPRSSSPELRITADVGVGKYMMIGTDVPLRARVAWSWGNEQSCCGSKYEWTYLGLSWETMG